MNNHYTYSEALHKLSRQAEILWYNNHPEVPPSFCHCFLTIGECEPLDNKVLRDSKLSSKGIYTVRTEHAHAMRDAWFKKSDPDSPSTHMTSSTNTTNTLDNNLPQFRHDDKTVNVPCTPAATQAPTSQDTDTTVEPYATPVQQLSSE